MMLDREHWLSGCFMDNVEEINMVYKLIKNFSHIDFLP